MTGSPLSCPHGCEPMAQTVCVRDVVCPRVVGRDAELALLRRRFDSARDGHGRVIFVVGEPGIGKSRLVREVAGWARDCGVPVLAGRAVPEPTGGLLRPIAEVLMQAFRGRTRPDDAELSRWLPALERLVPSLATPTRTPAAAAVVGSAVPDGDDTTAVRGEALIRTFRWLRGEASLLVLLEDLHWADAETIAIVEYLADNLASESVLVVCTVRDAASPTLDVARRLRQRAAAGLLALGRLDDAAVQEMVRACVPDADSTLADRVRASADGVPLLVEEVLAAPGVPATIGDTVRARVAAFSTDQRRVLSAAAILGREFDWRILPAIANEDASIVAAALEAFVDANLVEVVGDGFRFRHALIRDAVADGTMPPTRLALARAALETLDRVEPAGVYVDVAVQAGDLTRASRMLIESGRDALRRGALATAVDTLRRAVDLVDDDTIRCDAQAALVNALAQAGRLDEATTVAVPLLRALGAGAAAQAVQLDMAAAAVSATRWTTAANYIQAAGEPVDNSLTARMAVLRSEIALAADQVDGARAAAEFALRVADADRDPAIVCHALELLGRSHRVHDLERAKKAFQRAYEVATRAELPVSQLRALHELGTVDLLDHAGTDRLIQARAVAERLGLLSTVAVLDIQLAAAYLQRFEPEPGLDAIRRCLSLAQPLRLDRLRTFTYVFTACAQALRGDRDAVRAAQAEALRLAPDDAEVSGLVAAGGVGVLELLWGSRAAAIASLDSGLNALHTVAHSPPGPYRGLWPLVVAVAGRADARSCAAAVRQSGVAVNRVNRGYLEYADAVVNRSVEGVTRGDVDLQMLPVWHHVGRALVAEAALRDGWGDPHRWLAEAGACLGNAGLYQFARHCDRLRGGPGAWSPAGSTPREADVLALVADGLSNREVATRLRLSVRTVEKHVESLLRKAQARSRTHLAAMVKAGGPT
jgi:DNA-binding CsgD family transcriptional regulator/tetratricopeptide (TPR) repeat protein